MAAGKKNGHVRGIMGSPYRSYVWKGTKDPAIDQLRTVIQDEGVNYTQLHVMSNVSLTTFNNWFNGPTRRPSNAALEAAFGALGWERIPQRKRVIDIEKEVDAGKRWIERHKKDREKER